MAIGSQISVKENGIGVSDVVPELEALCHVMIGAETLVHAWFTGRATTTLSRVPRQVRCGCVA